MKKLDGRRHNVPPKHSQFQKGQSGNKSGRPKRTDIFNEIVQRILMERITISANGRPKKVTKLEAIVMGLANRAALGDEAAMGIYQLEKEQIDRLRAPPTKPAIRRVLVDPYNNEEREY